MPMYTTDSELSNEVLSLIDAWFAQETTPSVDPELYDEDVFLNCLGFTTAAAECTQTYLKANPDNRIPRGAIARLLYELGLSCVWLKLTGTEGFDAMQFEHERQKKALAGSVAGIDMGAETRIAADAVLNQDLGTKPKLADAVRNVERMMSMLDSGEVSLYTLYRLYSPFAHASLAVANSYVQNADDGKLEIHIPGIHHATNDHLGTAVAPFIWAVNAVNQMLTSQPFTSQLERLRLMLGTNIDFQLKALD